MSVLFLGLIVIVIVFGLLDVVYVVYICVVVVAGYSTLLDILYIVDIIVDIVIIVLGVILIFVPYWILLQLDSSRYYPILLL